MVVNEVEGEEHELLGHAAFAPQGHLLAYWARDEDRWIAVVGGKKSEPFGTMSTLAFTFSPDGETVAYAGCRDGKDIITVGEHVGGAFRSIRPYLPKFGPDGRTVAYVGWRENKAYIVAGRRTWGPFDYAAEPVWSPDGRKLAFGARIGREVWWKVVEVKDSEGGPR
jgi:hypothetical protein